MVNDLAHEDLQSLASLHLNDISERQPFHATHFGSLSAEIRGSILAIAYPLQPSYEVYFVERWACLMKSELGKTLRHFVRDALVEVGGVCKTLRLDAFAHAFSMQVPWREYDLGYEHWHFESLRRYLGWSCLRHIQHLELKLDDSTRRSHPDRTARMLEVLLEMPDLQFLKITPNFRYAFFKSLWLGAALTLQHAGLDLLMHRKGFCDWYDWEGGVIVMSNSLQRGWVQAKGWWSRGSERCYDHEVMNSSALRAFKTKYLRMMDVKQFYLPWESTTSEVAADVDFINTNGPIRAIWEICKTLIHSKVGQESNSPLLDALRKLFEPSTAIHKWILCKQRAIKARNAGVEWDLSMQGLERLFAEAHDELMHAISTS